MEKLLFVAVSLALALPAHATSIYKCVKGDKIVFSQISCPKDFNQHQVTYQLGITTETSSEANENARDPLQALLNQSSISKEKLLQLIDSELYRLKQENSYYDILRASERQKIDRKRYWQKQAKDDPEFVAQLQEMNDHFDGLININLASIKLLTQHQTQIEAESAEQSSSQAAASSLP